MFATRALRASAAHAERAPMIKFLGKRITPGKFRIVCLSIRSVHLKGLFWNNCPQFFLPASSNPCAEKQQPRSTTRLTHTRPLPPTSSLLTSSRLAPPQPFPLTDSTPSSTARWVGPSPAAWARPPATPWAPSLPPKASSLTGTSCPYASVAPRSTWRRLMPLRLPVLRWSAKRRVEQACAGRLMYNYLRA